MENIVWDDKFNIGVDVIDKAHAKLFRIARKLSDASEDPNAPQQTYREGLKYFETYSMAHFAEEEAYMRSIRYRGYAQHKKIHDNFRDKTLVSLKKDLELSNYSSTAIQRFVGIITNWLAEHIMREDQAIVGRIYNKSGQDLSSQIAIISRALNRASMDTFQLETSLIIPDYKGQGIGHEVYYCRQAYHIDGGLMLQLLLGVEEPLMLRGRSRIYGTKKIPAGGLASETLLPVFGQLLSHMEKVFKAEAENELNKDNLLDTDSFRADFMKGYSCSLLFGTKVGYLIFCYRSWRAKNQKAGN